MRVSVMSHLLPSLEAIRTKYLWMDERVQRIEKKNERKSQVFTIGNCLRGQSQSQRERFIAF